jgi:hypothetical protein
MITTNLQLDGECLREWQVEGIEGWTCLELSVGGEPVQVHLRRPPVKGFVGLDEDARALSLDEAAEVVMRLGIRVIGNFEC